MSRRCCAPLENACTVSQSIGVIGRVRLVRRWSEPRAGRFTFHVPALLTLCVYISYSLCALFGPIDSACCVRSSQRTSERERANRNKQEPPLLLPHHNIYRPLFGVEFPGAIYWRLIKINRLWLENTNVFYFCRALEYCLNVENMNLSAIRTIRVLRPLRAINRIPSKFAPFSPLYLWQCERRGTFTHTHLFHFQTRSISWLICSFVLLSTLGSFVGLNSC